MATVENEKLMSEAQLPADAPSDARTEQERAHKPRRDGQIIEKVKSKKYLVRLFLGRDTNGKRHYFSETIRGTRKDAEQCLREFYRRKQTGEPLRLSDVTFDGFLDEWLQAVKLRMREQSHLHYTRMVNAHIRPVLGQRRLLDLRASDIRALESKLKEDDYSSVTQRYVHMLLNNIFKQALIDERIQRNPMLGVTTPQLVRTEKPIPTPADARLIMAEAEKRGLRPLFELAFCTGLRPCEYLALKWSDLDQTARTIKVQRSLNWFNGGRWEEVEPKSQTSRRTLTLTPELIEGLQRQRKRQLEQRMKMGASWATHDFIFTNEIGEPYRREHVRIDFLECVEAAGLPAFQLRATRHATATELMVQGVNPKVVSEQLGHSDVSITLRAYSHVTKGLKEQAAETASKAFLG